MIETKDISCATPIIDKVNVSLAQGTLTGIIGPNGAGKTTLLKILAGLVKPDSGDVTLDGNSFDRLNPIHRARQIAYLEQYSFVHWPLNVSQLVALGRYPHRDNSDFNPQNDKFIVNQVMQDVGVHTLSNRKFNSLSGGERARVLLARSLAVQAGHLLVDEPIASLDLKYQFEIMQLLSDQTRKGICVCVILHDLNLAAKYCDYLYLIDKGKVAYDGSPNHVLNPESIKSTFDINARVIQKESGIEIYPMG